MQEHITWEHLFLRCFLHAVFEFHDILERHPHLEDLILKMPVFDRFLDICLYLILISGVCVDYIPAHAETALVVAERHSAVRLLLDRLHCGLLLLDLCLPGSIFFGGIVFLRLLIHHLRRCHLRTCLRICLFLIRFFRHLWRYRKPLLHIGSNELFCYCPFLFFHINHLFYTPILVRKLIPY